MPKILKRLEAIIDPANTDSIGITIETMDGAVFQKTLASEGFSALWGSGEWRGDLAKFVEESLS